MAEALEAPQKKRPLRSSATVWAPTTQQPPPARLAEWELEAQHLEALAAGFAARRDGPLTERRSSAWQGPRRQVECRARRRAVSHLSAVVACGISLCDTASSLGVAPRTLRHWRQLERSGTLVPAARGRPLRRAPPDKRNDVIALLRVAGPTMGVRPLRRLFPAVARGELRSLVFRFRSVIRRTSSARTCRLRWLQGGAVWALDHAVPPSAVDGHGAAILAVRDLGTGEQLLWKAVRRQSARETTSELGALFGKHPAPLVLKSDLGSAFGAGLFQRLLSRERILWLPSPARTPQYNGSCERSIRTLKEHTDYQARRRGRLGKWSGWDLEHARVVTNALRRFLHAQAPQADLGASARDTLEQTVARYRRELRQRNRLARQQGERIMNRMDVERRAVERALVELGFLQIRSRRKTLPLSSRKAAKIT